jgi:hypothetical protein
VSGFHDIIEGFARSYKQSADGGVPHDLTSLALMRAYVPKSARFDSEDVLTSVLSSSALSRTILMTSKLYYLSIAPMSATIVGRHHVSTTDPIRLCHW